VGSLLTHVLLVGICVLDHSLQDVQDGKIGEIPGKAVLGKENAIERVNSALSFGFKAIVLYDAF
jgi:hypothetical protein